MAKALPQPAGDIVSAVVGNKQYVFGSYDGVNVQPQGIVAEYDSAADTWTMKKNMLLPAHHAAAVELNGKIYVFGGFVGRAGAKGWGPVANAFECTTPPLTAGRSSLRCRRRAAPRWQLRSTARSMSLARRMPNSRQA